MIKDEKRLLKFQLIVEQCGGVIHKQSVAWIKIFIVINIMKPFYSKVFHLYLKNIKLPIETQKSETIEQK